MTTVPVSSASPQLPTSSGAGSPAEAAVAPVLLAPEHVATALSVSRDHVFKLMRNGELPFVRIGRFYRVADDDLREFIAIHRAVSSPPAGGLRVRVRSAP